MATISENYPLYYEATNEKGLSIAGLNFPENAVYFEKSDTKDNIAPFELIPWILCQCKNICEAKSLLIKINIYKINFSEKFKVSPLHWLIADENSAITLEQTKDGLKIYDNPVGVLTNNPTFDFHMTNLSNFMNLTPLQPENRFSKNINLKPYSLGMGAIGLPGDLSSASRFIRATFAKTNSVSDNCESESVNQFFHILSNVEQPRGLNSLEKNKFEYTLYSCCCNTNKGIYYYTTYENSQISAVNMYKENLNKESLIFYPLTKLQFFRQN